MVNVFPNSYLLVWYAVLLKMLKNKELSGIIFIIVLIFLFSSSQATT